MNCKPIIFLLCFNLICLCLLHTGDCFRLFRRRNYAARDDMLQPYAWSEARAPLVRQGPFFPSMLTGPLALATFLFAIPLLPSLLMAPLALAGIPSALNVLSSLTASFTNGRPINSLLTALSDPLQLSSASATEGGTSNAAVGGGKPIGSLAQQVDTLKSIAKLFRSAISRRNIVNQNVMTPELETEPEKVSDNEINELLLQGLNSTANSLSSNEISANNGSAPIVEMEKSIRAMDAVITSLRDVYSVIRNGLRRYEITDSDCQSRIVCEIHQKVISRNKMLKSFSLNAIDVLSLEKQVDSWGKLNDKSKRTIKYYIAAAKTGFADKDCTKVYENCPTLHARSLHHLRNILFNRHAAGKR